jgi:hypothetical protein
MQTPTVTPLPPPPPPLPLQLSIFADVVRSLMRILPAASSFLVRYSNQRIYSRVFSGALSASSELGGGGFGWGGALMGCILSVCVISDNHTHACSCS